VVSTSRIQNGEARLKSNVGGSKAENVGSGIHRRVRGGTTGTEGDEKVLWNTIEKGGLPLRRYTAVGRKKEAFLFGVEKGGCREKTKTGVGGGRVSILPEVKRDPRLW